MQHRRTRRLLCLALTAGFVIVLIAAGWTTYSTAASASGFSSPAIAAGTARSVRYHAGVAPRADWSANGSVGGTHYSALDEISRANVDSLKVAWVFRTGDVSDGAAESSGPATAFEATPLMLDGTLYIATPSARVIALDPERGTPRWTFDAQIDRASLAHNEVTTRGVSAWVDSARPESMPCRTRIFLATFDARTARHRFRARRIHPRGDASRRNLIVRERCTVNLCIECPPRRSTLGIERNHARGRRGDVERAVEHERRSFERRCRTAALRGAIRHIPGAKHPGDFERVDVCSRDFVERRIVSAANGAVRRPVGTRRHTGMVSHRKGRSCGDRRR